MRLYRYNVRYFLPRHFKCPHCGLGGLVPPLVGLVDLLAVAWGAPLRVVSAFRCPEWNRKYSGGGGDVTSRHCSGLAVDLAPREGVLLGVFGAMARDFCSGFEDVEVFNHHDSVHITLPVGHVSRFWAGEVISFDIV